VGLPAGALVGAVVVSAARTQRRWRAWLDQGAEGHDGSLEVIVSDEPMAYAVPGRPGHIAVSVGMLRLLDPAERQVLLAHERAHLHGRHHRYLWVVALSSAAVPVLRPLRSRIRLATERWADEVACREVGDRRLVARTVARAALARDAYPEGRALAMAEAGAVARVEALLRRPAHRAKAVAATTAQLAVLGAVAASAAVQLHHAASFLTHVCAI
jgi:hypothetical protein